MASVLISKIVTDGEITSIVLGFSKKSIPRNKF